jgi:glycopeptide antibiotics resistance protein
MKSAPKTLLALYILVLVWLVLFKFSFDLSEVFAHHIRILDLVPFSGSFRENLPERISNVIAFVPFGLLLQVNFKQTSVWQKLAFICAFSIAVETFQYIFAIGATDITDVITNTLGGLLGLALYDLGKRYVDSQKLDRFIAMAGAFLVAAFILLRVFVFRVRY